MTAAQANLHWVRKRLTHSSKPIIIGPWRSEVGFEVLYWLPFLHWIFRTTKIAPVRLHVISRGGAGCWYGVPDAQAIDLYTLRSVDEVRLENNKAYQRHKELKQTRWWAWEQDVIRQAARTWDLKRYQVLHPSVMYRLFEGFFKLQRPIMDVGSRANWAAIAKPALSADIDLPKDFIATHFYGRATFPPEPTAVRKMVETLYKLAANRPVVVLGNPHPVDDHVDFPINGKNIYHLPVVAPAQTLRLLSGVLARARAFIGTYGGIAQLALRMGVPSLSFYKTLEGTCQAHVHMSQTVSILTGVPFYVVALNHIGMLGTIGTALSSQAIPHAEKPDVAIQ